MGLVQNTALVFLTKNKNSFVCTECICCADYSPLCIVVLLYALTLTRHV